MSDRLPGAPGTYLLILQLAEGRRVNVGALGRFELAPGFYTYVGSALGPGGLKARVRRHLRATPNPYWHVDYLKPTDRVAQIWYAEGDERRECDWAARLHLSGEFSLPMEGFGASDCRCAGHLFMSRESPSQSTLEEVLGVRLNTLTA